MHNFSRVIMGDLDGAIKISQAQLGNLSRWIYAFITQTSPLGLQPVEKVCKQNRTLSLKAYQRGKFDNSFEEGDDFSRISTS